MARRNPLKDFAESLKRGEILIPKLKAFLEKEARRERKGLIEHADIVKEDARLSIKTFKERREEYNHRAKLEGEYFHPSQIGACMRKLVFHELKAPCDEATEGEALLKNHLTFEIGTYFHVMFQNLCERAGLLTRREIAIMDKKLRIVGHCDAEFFIPNKTYTGELKTINSRQFTALTEPHEAHRQQVTAYMKACGREDALIIYFDKDRSAVKEFPFRFSEKFWLTKVKFRIDLFFDSVKNRKLPPREGESPYKYPCMFCPYARICFDTMELKKWMSKEGVKHVN